ncbi:hypothetical protein G7054_g15249 [Neopestalotiopsis clavispora]|nr:hypothetical protein G7054_g15249 [Neopestalotiopsis clavispora]
MASLIVAAVFGAAVQAIALESTIAQATDASTPHPTFQLPKVTEPPNPSAVHELLKRADIETVLVGPDNTCGYVSGLLGAAYTCQNQNAVCAFVTAANTGYAACCDDSNCAFVADCMDASQVENGDCNNGCMNDIYTAKCTASSAPYCGTIRFDTSITDYFCHSLSYSTAMDALTTWIGENDGRSFSEVVVTLTSSSFGDESGGLALSSTRSASGASSSGDVQSGSSSATSGTSTSTSTGAAGGQKSSTPVGAIAGGVVGGVAVIALIGLGIWLILRRSRKQQANAVPPMTQQYPPAQQPQQPPTGYAPSPPGGAPGAPGAPLFGAAQPQTTPSYDYQQQQPSYQNGAVMHTYDGSKPPQWGTPSPPPQGGANGGFNTTQQGGGARRAAP